MGLAYGFNITTDVKKIAKELKDEYELTDFEALTLALKVEQNELLKRAFVISSTDSHPTGLEAIATAIGYRNR